MLCIEDDADVLTVLSSALRRHGAEAVETATDGSSGIAKARTFQPDLVLCDLMMPYMSGMEFYGVLQEQFPALARHVVFMTGGSFTEAARSFIAQVPNPTMEKPFVRDHLEEVLCRLAVV